jgi:hypothetical protein
LGRTEKGFLEANDGWVLMLNDRLYTKYISLNTTNVPLEQVHNEWPESKTTEQLK